MGTVHYERPTTAMEVPKLGTAVETNIRNDVPRKLRTAVQMNNSNESA
jgi:hypothetical protein